VVEREFDTVAKDFVKDGFSLPKAKSQVAWRDGDTLWVGTDFGEGSLTNSGYPHLVNLWKRGTPRGAPVRVPLEDAALSPDRPSASRVAASSPERAPLVGRLAAPPCRVPLEKQRQQGQACMVASFGLRRDRRH
jgi:hypothetical protein